MKFIGSSWADRDNSLPKQAEVAPYASKRRAAVAKAFKGKVILIAAGDAKQRSNDTEYRYRAHSAFSHLSGWGVQTVPGSILVIDARKTAKATLFSVRPPAATPMSFLPTRQSENFGLVLVRP